MEASSDQNQTSKQEEQAPRRIPDLQVLHELDEILDELAFAGFNPRLLRIGLYEKGLQLKELIMILGAYLSVGNKISKIEKRRLTDKARITAYSAVFTKYDITDSGVRKNPSDITLAQVAIAFSPIVLMLRTHAAERGNLQNQFPQSGLMPVFQDPCLGPLAVVSGLELEYRRYSYQFFKALAPTRQQSPAREIDWLQIACAGFSQDLAAGEVLAAMSEGSPSIQELAELMMRHDRDKTGRTTDVRLSSTISDVRMKAAMDLEQKADESASANLLSLLAPSGQPISTIVQTEAAAKPVPVNPAPQLKQDQPARKQAAVAPAAEKRGLMARVFKR